MAIIDERISDRTKRAREKLHVPTLCDATSDELRKLIYAVLTRDGQLLALGERASTNIIVQLAMKRYFR